MDASALDALLVAAGSGAVGVAKACCWVAPGRRAADTWAPASASSSSRNTPDARELPPFRRIILGSSSLREVLYTSE